MANEGTKKLVLDVDKKEDKKLQKVQRNWRTVLTGCIKRWQNML